MEPHHAELRSSPVALERVIERKPRRISRTLTPTQIDAIRHTWRLIEASDPIIASSCLMRNFTTLAPSTTTLFQDLQPAQIISGIGAVLAVLTSTNPCCASVDSVLSASFYDNDEETAAAISLQNFIARVAQLRELDVVRALEPETFPSMHRGFLFFVWKMIEDCGATYTDDVAMAFSALCDIVEETLCEVSSDERRQRAYLHHRAPGSVVSLESPEAITFHAAMS